MATMRTLWRPDTCGCAVTYQWDNAAEPRVLTPVELTPCPLHVGFDNLQDAFDSILAHNRMTQQPEG